MSNSELTKGEPLTSVQRFQCGGVRAVAQPVNGFRYQVGDRG